MGKSNIPVYSCDRCGRADEIRQPHQSCDWGEIWFAQENGPTWIGSLRKHDKELTICPDCLKAVMTWWRAGRSALSTDRGEREDG